jgi:hypothetical protein
MTIEGLEKDGRLHPVSKHSSTMRAVNAGFAHRP